MSITNGYCTLAQLKAETGISDSEDDSLLEETIEEASRDIDNACGRHFFADTGQTRYFTAERDDYLAIDDCYSVTTLKTDDDGDRTYENTWATTDYDLMPFNAANTGWPYTCIEPTPDGDYLFTRMRKGVEIVGNFGWSAVPKPIRKACKMWSHRLFKRKDAPFGVVGATRAGGEMRIQDDPDIMRLLQPYIRHS